MFKLSDSFEQEIALAMNKNLNQNLIEKRFNFNKIAQAVAYLNSAAEIFEKSNMTEEADQVVKVLANLVETLGTYDKNI